MGNQTREPQGPISTDSLPWRDWKQGQRFGGRIRGLSEQYLQEWHVGVYLEELQPGKQSCPAHYHLQEEEHIFILQGEVTLRLGDKWHAMRTGDYACFPAGQPAGHCLVNESNAPCRYLVIGENKPHETCVYTDSNKLQVRSPGSLRVLDLLAARNYWDGEREDEPPSRD
jgi:uncharacterized cupin superfamily protein